MPHIPEVLPKSIPIPGFIVTTFSYIWYYLNLVLLQIPGGDFLIHYVRKSHQDDPYRTFVEIVLILYGIYYYLSKPQQKKGLQSNRPNLSSQEVDDLIEDWQPEPIVDPSVMELQRWRLDSIPVIDGTGVNKRVTIFQNGRRHENVLNLSSNNFLHLSQTPRVLNVAKSVIQNYGVGACGPAGFYGNQDVHYNLEYRLADFFGTESAVLYGQDFCTSASVIPAFTKRGDLLVADEKVSLGVQNALQLSRSTVYYYEHNNMESLEAILSELVESEKKENLPAISRKFIVTEGIFQNTGDIPPLPQLVELKNRYKFRLFVDETLSLGVLGKTGRGLTEYYGLAREDSIDITVGSMAHAFGSSGAFVLGDAVMSHHQRIGSYAYCFSASLPPYTARCVDEVLRILGEDHSSVNQLQKFSKLLYNEFSGDSTLSKYVEITSCPFSPILHLRLTPELRYRKFGYSAEDLFCEMMHQQKRVTTTRYIEPYEQEERFLQEIVNRLLLESGILITRNTIVIRQESLPFLPSLKICVNSGLQENEILESCRSIKKVLIKSCSE
ncbi:serine palmitoyltransferase component [Zygosaccharomyces mellis]|uniref:serine C-palmitoyltransferase n=1 Tax=Zygosaccharomyces mellis TaxID=42258 RepID=A0A4C2E1S0_9SACH|nr:serine palmitoyltransferase component [Zygosaccharomyces mellis]